MKQLKAYIALGGARLYAEACHTRDIHLTTFLLPAPSLKNFFHTLYHVPLRFRWQRLIILANRYTVKPY